MPDSLIWAVFVVALMASSWLRERCSAIAAGLLLVNWGACWLLAVVTDNQFYWYALAAIDYVTAIGILACTGGWWQRLIVMVYAVDLVAHASYGVSDKGPWADYYYWELTHTAIWAQALLLWGWVGHGAFKRYRRVRHPHGGIQPSAGLHPEAVLERSGQGLEPWGR